MDCKTFAGNIEIKGDGSKGQLEAEFARFDNVHGDLEGDVHVRGCFDEGAKVLISDWGHALGQQPGSRPAGHGTIHNGQNAAIVRAQFHMHTETGRDVFNGIKSLVDAGMSNEWSYAYQVIDHEFDKVDGTRVRRIKRSKVYECSPVMRGMAGEGMTRTLSAKGQCQCGCHGSSLPPDLAHEMRMIHGELIRQDWVERREGEGHSPADDRRRLPGSNRPGAA